MSDQLLAQARNLLQTGKLNEAEKIFRTILRQAPEHLDALHFLAMLSYQKGEHDLAMQMINKAISIQPNIPHFYCSLATILTAMGKPNKAIISYKKAISLQPDLAEAYYNLGILQRQTGDYDAAIQSYQTVIRLKPEFVLAYSALGNAYRDIDQLENAETQFRKSVQFRPQNTESHLSLAAVLRKRNQLEDALTHFQKVLQLDPGNIEAVKGVADVKMEQEQFHAAIELYEKVLAQDPAQLNICNNLGVLYTKINNFEKAIDYFRKSLELDPNNISAITSLANALEKTSLLDEAEKVVLHGLSVDRDSTPLNIALARIERGKGNIKGAIKRLQNIPESAANLSQANAIKFLLGQLHDKEGNNKLAFSFFTEANQISERRYIEKNIDKNESLKNIESISNLLTPGLIKCRSFSGPLKQDAPPVFLVGFPRSGTTLLDQILNSHSSIQTLEEVPTVTAVENKFISIKAGQQDALTNLTDDEIGSLRGYYFQLVEHFLGSAPKHLVVDKMPLNLYKAHFIWRIFPESRFILAIRHPCDACLSCFMQDFGQNVTMANFVSLEGIARLYAKVMTLWQHYISALPIQYHMIRYEDLITGVKSEAKKVLDFLDVEWEDNILEHTSNAKARGRINTPSYHQVTQPIYQDARYRWKRYEEELEPIMDILQPFIEYFGYAEK